MSEGENEMGGRVAGVGVRACGSPERGSPERDIEGSDIERRTGENETQTAGERVARGDRNALLVAEPLPAEDALLVEEAAIEEAVAEEAVVDDHWLADGVLDVGSAPVPPPSVVIVDADAVVRATLLEHLAPACAAHEAEPAGAVALLQGLTCVDIALVDCDPPPSQQAPIFRALSRWPGAVCVLMSQNQQKVEQLRALGMFAPLVLDKPLQPEALDAIRAAVLEIADSGMA